MKLEHMVALAVRLFAVALAIHAVRNIAISLPYFFENDWLMPLYGNIFVTVGQLLVAIALWKFPQFIANKLTNFQDNQETAGVTVSPDQILVISLTLLGLYLTFYVFSDIVYWGSVWLMTQSEGSIPVSMSAENQGHIFATIAESIFVFFLLFGQKRLVELLRKARYGGDS